jgi:AcrR family transcriptional regulator
VRIARDDDLTARARIRDAAIECFASEGFGASFRTIAAHAGVSPGLITHHFGSKGALRDECDAEVLRRYRELKSEAVDHASAYLLKHLSDPGGSPTVLIYLVRAVHAGGPAARNVLDRLMDDARALMRQGVENGLIRASRDEEARLRYLTYQTMGALLVQFLTAEPTSPAEFVASMRERDRELILPILELGTEGYLADRSMLDDYVRDVWEPLHRPGATSPDPATTPDRSAREGTGS